MGSPAFSLLILSVTMTPIVAVITLHLARRVLKGMGRRGATGTALGAVLVIYVSLKNYIADAATLTLSPPWCTLPKLLDSSLLFIRTIPKALVTIDQNWIA